jgi:hypothetical protein
MQPGFIEAMARAGTEQAALLSFAQFEREVIGHRRPVASAHAEDHPFTTVASTTEDRRTALFWM